MKKSLVLVSAFAIAALPTASAFAQSDGARAVKLSKCDALWQNANPNSSSNISAEAAAAYLTDVNAANPDGDSTIEKDEFYFACGAGLIKKDVLATSKQPDDSQAMTVNSKAAQNQNKQSDTAQVREIRKPDSSSSTEKAQAHQSGSTQRAGVEVETAGAIVGQPLRNSEGDTMGEIEYLLINPVSGKVDFVVIGRGGFLDLGENLVSVPWAHLDVVPGSGQTAPRVSLAADAPSLSMAPRLKWDQISSLTKPIYVTRVMTYFGDAADGNETAAATDEGTSANSKTENKSESSESKGGSLLVARSYITALGPPLTQWRSEIAGATLLDTKGNEIGEIAHLVIDTQRGQVAYAVISQGGFLGFGNAMKPVPLEALKWRDEGQFVLEGGAKQLEAVPTLTGESFPTRIKSIDLKSLYERFDVQPYWSS